MWPFQNGNAFFDYLIVVIEFEFMTHMISAIWWRVFSELTVVSRLNCCRPVSSQFFIIHVKYPSLAQFWNEYLAAKAYTEKLKAEFGDDYKHEIDIKRKNSGFWGNAPQKGFLVRLELLSITTSEWKIEAPVVLHITLFLAWSQFCIQYHKRKRKIVPSIQPSMFGGNPRKEKVHSIYQGIMECRTVCMDHPLNPEMVLWL